MSKPAIDALARIFPDAPIEGACRTGAYVTVNGALVRVWSPTDETPWAASVGGGAEHEAKTPDDALRAAALAEVEHFAKKVAAAEQEVAHLREKLADARDLAAWVGAVLKD